MPSFGSASSTTVPIDSADEVAAAWGSWIASMGSWELFGALTYDQKRRRLDAHGDRITPGVDVAKAHVWRWLKDAPRVIGRPIDAAVVALEYQQNGWPHFHPLLHIAGELQGDEIRGLGGAWFAKHGATKLEVPRSSDDVCAYAAKYLAKDLSRGDVILWRLNERAAAAAARR